MSVKFNSYVCVFRLTQSDPESLFNKLEVIVVEYINEVRSQVLKRIQTCPEASNDVQLFISYLLDKYQTFIQAVKCVSTIVSYFVRVEIYSLRRNFYF